MSAESPAGASTFFCQRCGNCCRVPGYVRLLPAEVETISKYIGIDVSEFTSRFTRLTADRTGLSLVENADRTCVFLGEEDGGCRIQSVKPEQCRRFPTDWHFDGYQVLCGASNAEPNHHTVTWTPDAGLEAFHAMYG